ncbi:MAG: substrate-binding domain-containing protein [Caldilineaceae bacterium]|nr:substrate-binding domain-containing protein [Caldilineaceae bacterium]
MHRLPDSDARSLSRRQLLKGMVWVGSAAIGANLLAACAPVGAPAPATAPSTPTPEPDLGPDPGAFTAFQPSDTVGEIPNLPRRIAWANTSNAEFFLAITNAIQLAAEDRDLEFITAIANDDSARNIEQINTFLQRGIAALCIQPLDANAQAPLMQQAIDDGIAVMSLVTPPSTVQAVADQYKVGYTQGLAAAKWITENLGGQAKVHYFNIDTIEVLIARHQGVLDGVRTAGEGVEIVSDVNAGAITNEAGFNTMNTVLQAHPDINVILGGDTLVLGALAAIEAAGRAGENIYMSGIDGDAEALNKVREGGPYKASFAFAYPMMGYAWGQYAADWLEGKSIPQVMQFNAIELNSAESIDAFEQAMSNVRDTWQDADTYFTNLGSISYETRDQYVRVAA